MSLDEDAPAEHTSGSSAVAPPTVPAVHAPDVSAVSIQLKLPPFWPADPELWFAQVEAQFACRRIVSQRSRFDYVVSSLSPEYAAEVRDLLLRPPTDDPYSTLKTQLIKRTTASEQRKLQLLFTSEELGDKKPTQLLRRMQQLLGDRPAMADESFLRELFLQRLPPNVRMVLASTPETTSLPKLAELADKVIEVATPPGAIASVSASSTDISSEVHHLREEVSRLEKLVKKLSHSSRSTGRHTTRSPRRSPTPSSHHPPNSPDHQPPATSDIICWYHQKFGSQAQRCKSPCSYQSNPQART